jgi:hypothetical protein
MLSFFIRVLDITHGIYATLLCNYIITTFVLISFCRHVPKRVSSASKSRSVDRHRMKVLGCTLSPSLFSYSLLEKSSYFSVCPFVFEGMFQSSQSSLDLL